MFGGFASCAVHVFTGTSKASARICPDHAVAEGVYSKGMVYVRCESVLFVIVLCSVHAGVSTSSLHVAPLPPDDLSEASPPHACYSHDKTAVP
jgi:hypothetical protein